MRSYLQKHSKIQYSDHWSTPQEIYVKYKRMQYYDPCPLGTTSFSFLPIDKPIFLNPPYSDITKWVEWALMNHHLFNKHIVILIPSRTDTRYFHKLLEYGCDLEFIKGRLKFGDSKQGAPFPSVLVHLGIDHYKQTLDDIEKVRK